MPVSSPLFVEIGQGLSLMIGLPTITSWTNTKRPKTARRGTIGFNTETSSLEYWDGTDWFAAPLHA